MSNSNTKLRLRWILDQYRKKGIELRHYQIEGIRWMLNRESKGYGGILADEPGLGKTYQSLAIALSSNGQTLVIVPASIIDQWVSDANKLKLPTSVVYLHHGKSRRKLAEHFPEGTKIVITTPSTLLNSGVESPFVNLQSHLWKRVIFDEVQVMKSKSSAISKCAKSLRSETRWGLTGTPVQNHSAETINLFRFVMKVSDKVRLRLDWCLHNLLLRRTKKQYLDLECPEIDNIVVDFRTEEERTFYHKVRKDIKEEFMSLEASGLNRHEMMAALFELLLRMRQTSIHPQLVIDGYRKKYGQGVLEDWKHPISSKHEKLIEFIRQHPQDSAIVFCQFVQEINLLTTIFQQKGWRVERIDGQQKNRQGVIRRCQDNSISQDQIRYGLSRGRNCLHNLPEDLLTHILGYSPKIDVLFIQIRAGGVGLNLQRFNRIYFTSPDWNPTNEIQAMARAHRLGQTKKVFVKNLVLDDSKEPGSVVDDRIIGIQEGKRKLAAQLLKDDDLLYHGKWTGRANGLNFRQLRRLLT